jgi:hypothetical protein
MKVQVMEQEILAKVSGQRLMEYTTQIAQFERLSGSEEERASFRYVKEVLDGFGVPTKLLEHDAYVSIPGPARLEIDGAPGPDCYTTSFGVNTPPDGVTAEVVYCGAGTPAELAGRDLRGKIALLDGLPAAPKTLAVEAAGAIGQINIAGKHLHWMIISPVWGSPTPDRLDRLPKRPCVTIRSEEGEGLKALLQQRPVRATLHTQVDTGWRKTPLLVAEIPGADEDFILFSGHLDSWALGAMDNGTANATMIECTRVLWERRAELRRSIRVAFWSGHSHGRYSGSTWYVDHHWEELHQHCVSHVNIDSVGAKGASVLTEAIVMAETRGLAQAVIGEQTGQHFEGRRIGRMGDQSFVGLGIPSMFMSLSEQEPSEDATSRAMTLRLGGNRSGGLGWWWHTAEDTMDKIDQENLVRDARVYAAVLWRFATSPVLPLDVAAGTAEWVSLLKGLQEAAGDRFDLTRAVARAEKLAVLGKELHRLASTADAQAADVNAILKGLTRALVPAGYTAGSPYDQDPALPTPAVPGLDPVKRLAALEPDSDDARFLSTQLVRARNRVEHALLQALTIAEEGLARLKRGVSE